MPYRFAVAVALLALLTGWFQLTWLLASLAICIIYLISGGWRFVRIVYLAFPRDLKRLIRYFKFVKKYKSCLNNRTTVADIFNETVDQYGDKVAFIFEDKQWTFNEVEAYSNRVANYFQSIGYKKGDVVALFLENRPELVFLWLGLSKIGVISALVNYNLKKQQLIHCISIVNCRGLVYSVDHDISGAVADVRDSLTHVQLFEFGSGSTINDLGAESLGKRLEDSSDKPPIQNFEKSANDVLLYIYTSGTTGCPKACLIRHLRFHILTFYLGYSLNQYGPNETLYNVLPLYHTSAGCIGVGAVFGFGVTMVVRRKFSASQFWNDCVKYNATWFLYIGELCRYIMAQPPKDIDKAHSIRFMIGNGLRPQLWKEFQIRYNIPIIHEFYGATEGNVGFVNITGNPGSVGFFSVTIPELAPPPIFVKMDENNEDFQRGPDGFCVLCKPGEVGQLLGNIRLGGNRNTRFFDGYLNKSATKKKIACDVVQKGDQWFLTGDTAYFDELGYVYFHDRIGDTFRWRGENVSTTELEGLMINILGLNSVVVVGVEIPGCEGRAGLAAIEDPDGAIDVSNIGKLISENVASYSRPVFLRITNSVDKTGTFKFQKSRLRKEGFDINVITDKMFYLDQKVQEYRALTKEVYQKFITGEMKV